MGKKAKIQITTNNFLNSNIKIFIRVSKELEDRFHNSSKAVRDYCRKVKWDIMNVEYIKQVIRSSGSISANYTEASDDLGKADEKMKLKLPDGKQKKLLNGLT